MDVFSRLKTFLRTREVTDDIHECRDCGTMVPPRENACPNCESTRIASYEI